MNDKHRIAMGLDLDGEEPVHDKLISEGVSMTDAAWFRHKSSVREKLSMAHNNRIVKKDPVLTKEEWISEFQSLKSPFNQPSLIWPESVVADIFHKGDNICYVGYDDGEGKSVVFFTNNYFFTDALGDSFVHVSSVTRGTAVPRKGCEDGLMNTPAKFKAVFHPESRYLYSHEELIDFLDELGRVKH